jgi:hypothetical protein
MLCWLPINPKRKINKATYGIQAIFNFEKYLYISSGGSTYTIRFFFKINILFSTFFTDYSSISRIIRINYFVHPVLLRSYSINMSIFIKENLYPLSFSIKIE